MESNNSLNSYASKIFHLIHKNFLLIILASYLIAVILPDLGIELRKVQFFRIDSIDFNFRLPKLMLAFLLFNAGLGIKLENLKKVIFKPITLLAGIISKIIVPLSIVFILSLFLNHWHNQIEAQEILLGIIILISMPIANSTPTWTQNIDGNIALSLGLVFFSTLLSPIVTPQIIEISKSFVDGAFREDIVSLIDLNTSLFLILSIVIPSCLGMICQKALGKNITESVKPILKLINLIVLITLIYSNASISLPQIISAPDIDFHVLIVILTLIVSILMFSSGWLIANMLKLKRKETISFVFASGMSNNGAGLILLSTALPNHPEALLPLIFFNLFQQIFASIVTMFYSDKDI